MYRLEETTWMPTFQTRLLSEIAAGHDGPTIPESKRVYFQERFRGRIFDFVIASFTRERQRGLTKATLARRIGKSPEVVNRWLAAPSNLTIDSISDLLLGIGAEEMEMSARSVLNRPAVNYRQLDDQPSIKKDATTSLGLHRLSTGNYVKAGIAA
jgi:hypothetical protein